MSKPTSLRTTDDPIRIKSEFGIRQLKHDHLFNQASVCLLLRNWRRKVRSERFVALNQEERVAVQQ